jgi:hypothetical protein
MRIWAQRGSQSSNLYPFSRLQSKRCYILCDNSKPYGSRSIEKREAVETKYEALFKIATPCCINCDMAQARVKGARTLIEITKLCSEALSGMMMSALRSGPASAAVYCAMTPTPDVARTTSVNWSPPWKRLLGVRTNISQYYRRTREKFGRNIVAL